MKPFDCEEVCSEARVPVLSGYLSLIITPSSSNLKFRDQGKKSELNKLQFWLFQNLKEPAVFITSKELWVSRRFSQYFSWFWEWRLYIYQNQFSQFLRTVIMRPKSGLNNHQGFDAISGTRTTPVTRHQEIPIYFSHESYHFCFTLPTRFTNQVVGHTLHWMDGSLYLCADFADFAAWVLRSRSIQFFSTYTDFTWKKIIHSLATRSILFVPHLCKVRTICHLSSLCPQWFISLSFLLFKWNQHLLAGNIRRVLL